MSPLLHVQLFNRVVNFNELKEMLLQQIQKDDKTDENRRFDSWLKRSAKDRFPAVFFLGGYEDTK